MAVIEPGMRFGFLTTLSKARENGRTYWEVICDCGARKKVQQGQIRGAKRPIKSCGCKRIELLRAAHLTHGQSLKGKSEHYSTFVAWQSMIWRCNNKARADYKHYGGRGISVCQRWASSFQNFIDDMGPKPSQHSLGRIDNDGNYEPNNCRWETLSQQARNKRTNRVITYEGKSMTLVEWAEATGLNRDTISKRLEAGWTVAQSITRPLGS